MKNYREVLAEQWRSNESSKILFSVSGWAWHTQNMFPGLNASFLRKEVQVAVPRRGTQLPVIVYTPETFREKQIHPENILLWLRNLNECCGIIHHKNKSRHLIKNPAGARSVAAFSEFSLHTVWFFPFLSSISIRQIGTNWCPSKFPFWRKP